MRNTKEIVGKQDLCEWSFKALKAAFTLENIKMGFCKTGIWPLDCMATIGAMTLSAGFGGRSGYAVVTEANRGG